MTRHSGEALHGECLLLASTTTDSVMLEAALQARGHRVRVIVAPGPDTFIEMVSERPYLALLVDLHFPQLRLREFTRELRRLPESPGVLAWTDAFQTITLREVLDAGANGLVSRSDSQLSLMLLEREMRIGQLQHAYAQVRERLGESARKDAAQLDDYDGCVVIVMEGIIVSCNTTASSILAEGDGDALMAMPVLDLLAADSVAVLRHAIRKVTRQRQQAVDVQLTWVAGENEVPMLMTVAAVDHDDGMAIELRARETGSSDDDATRREDLRLWLSEGQAPPQQHPMLVVFGLDQREGVIQDAGLLGLDRVMAALQRLLLSAPRSDVRAAQLDNTHIAVAFAAPTLDDTRDWVSGRLRNIGRHIFDANDKQLSLTASAAIHPLPDGRRDADTVLGAALEALAAAESSERISQIVMAGSEAHSLQRKDELRKKAALVREALDDNRFELAFQNIACLMDDSREHVDVLLRLRDHDNQPIAPGEFMPAAQEHGLMPAVDRWVVHNALRQLHAQAARGKSEVFFVRLDIATLRAPEDFLEWMKIAWVAAKLPPGALVLVLRERMLQTQLRNALKLLDGLRAIGLGTAIDHFGISSRSHELLERLPVDYVKLHADFTAAIVGEGDPIDSFQRILDVARDRGIHTIAEHVSNANAMARLWQLGVNFLMGNHVHAPANELKTSQFRIR